MISHNDLKEVLDYDQDTGIFTWKKNFHKPKIGTRAGCKKRDGYRVIHLWGDFLYEAPLAWFFVTGEYPILMVDHKNRIRDDNRWENLRLATESLNQANVEKRTFNKSGYKGVSYQPDMLTRHWHATIKFNGKTYSLGRFESKEDAALAYDVAAIKYFGEFAHLNFPDQVYPMTDLTSDERAVLMIAAEGESMIDLGEASRWHVPINSLVSKGLLKQHDKFNNVITPAGLAALGRADEDEDRELGAAIDKFKAVMSSKPVGPHVVEGRLFFQMPDGSTIQCTCIRDIYAWKIVEMWDKR